MQRSLKNILDFLIESTSEGQLSVVDAIFIFGHFDPRVALHVAKLYKLGRASKIVITGKGRDKIPTGFETEADYYASILTSEGVPCSALILERKSTNTLENAIFGIHECRNNNFYPVSIILCAMPPLLRRSCATFRKQFPEIAACGSAFDVSIEEYSNPFERIRRILGEFDRFDEYEKKGDIAKVLVPDSVKSAISAIKQEMMN